MEFIDRSKQLSKICARPDLSIKCSKSKKPCFCDSHGKRKKFKRRFSRHSPTSDAKGFYERKEASRSQQGVFYVEKKDTMQKMVLTNRRKRSNI
ncbi:hypothetical protein Bca4012_010374 [Brassica carinata]